MPPVTINGKNLSQILDSLREKHGVVGATLGVLKDGKVETAASGMLNQVTKVDVTADSVFQIGSISKVFTATLIMQLVDAGRVDLDASVKTYLPDFETANPAASSTITMRQLLCHTSGLDGDFFPQDDPDGPSAASYVRKMRLLPQLHGVGEHMSYSNSGYVVAGRIIEVLTNHSWSTAVMQNICQPLGMSHSFANPKDSLRYRCALGHVRDPKKMENIIPAAATFLPLSTAAAGAVLTMSVEDLLAFARCHMAGGKMDNGKRLLSEKSAKEMRKIQVELPPFSRRGINKWGLGWFLGDLPGYRMYGHDGGTFGHFAYLRVFPDKNVAFTMLTNSPSSKLMEEIEKLIATEWLGLELPPDPAPAPFEQDLARYVGTYENVGARSEIRANDNGLVVVAVDKVEGKPPEELPLKPFAPDCFQAQGKLPEQQYKMLFLGSDSKGRAEYARVGVRMARRVP